MNDAKAIGDAAASPGEGASTHPPSETGPRRPSTSGRNSDSGEPGPHARDRLAVRVFERWQDLETFVPSWEELSRNALEPSPSAEPWMLMPALRCALPGNKVRVVLVSGSAKDGQPVLCGVFPIEERPRYRGLPARTVRLWAHIYTLFPAPLLRQDRAVECLGAFFDWIRTEYPANTLVEFPELRANSGFFRLLSETLLKGSLTTLATGVHVRAFFRPKADHERYLGSVGTPHHRHEWRRQERRLSEKGTLAYAALDAQQDLGKWIDAFIALEMTGWKGREGTAFGSNPSHRAWLDEVARSAAERGRLMMLALELDGRPVAMKLNILCPPGSYAFKIAYDESLAKFSPGVLLELENIKRLHSDPALEWMDSLAAPGHSLMDRVWPDRTAIVSLLVAPGPWMGRLLLSSVPLLRMLKQGLTRRAAERREGAGQA